MVVNYNTSTWPAGTSGEKQNSCENETTNSFSERIYILTKDINNLLDVLFSKENYSTHTSGKHSLGASFSCVKFLSCKI